MLHIENFFKILWHFITKVFSWLWNNLTGLKDLASIIAIVAGLWWFLNQGLMDEKVHITHLILSKNIDKQYNLVHVNTKIKNIGKRPITINNGKVSLTVIFPLDKTLQNKIIRLNESERAITSWPIAYSYKNNIPMIIQPEEVESVDCSFLISKYIKVIQINSFFPKEKQTNSNNSKSLFGWGTKTIYDLSKEGI